MNGFTRAHALVLLLIVMTLTRNGRRIDAVAQITKSGHVFVFDRATGEPLFPIEEVAAPPSDLEGEQAWPTQPLPLTPPPFARQIFTEAEITDISPESRASVLERLRTLRTGHPFIPPSTQGTVIFPGFDGGGEWGGAAFDPHTGLLYVNSNEMPWVLTMVPIRGSEAEAGLSLGERTYRQNCAACHRLDGSGALEQMIPPVADIASRLSREETDEIVHAGGGVMPGFGTLSRGERDALVGYLFNDPSPADAADRAPEKLHGDRPEDDILYTHTGYNRFLDPDGYPAVKPPWGTLNAINLNTGEIAWQIPLGELTELEARGVPQTGTENYGGPLSPTEA